MRYLSTRGHADRKQFCEILLEGLAPDGGLYLPESYPQLDDLALTRLREIWQSQGYAALAFEILSLYIDDIPAAVSRPTHQRFLARKKSCPSNLCKLQARNSQTCI